MKKTITVLFLIILSVSILAGLVVTGCGAKQEVVNLRYTFAAAPQGALGESIQWFADEVGRRTNGAVNIKISFGGTLLAMPDTVPGIGSRIADCGLGMGSFTINQNPHWSTLSRLGAGNDLWAIIRAGYDMVTTNKKIKDELAAQNLVPLTGYSAGTPIYVLKKSVTKMADLKGLRVAAMSPDEAKIMPQLGIEPVQILMPESYDALDKGVIDGTAGTIAFAQSIKWYEVAKYWMQFSNNLPAGDVTTLFNKNLWNSLTPQTRKIIMDVAKEFSDVYARKVIEAQDATLKTVAAQYNVQIFKAPPEINKVYQDALAASREAYFQQWDAQGYDTRGIWDEFQKLVAKYEKEVAEKGYPWQR